MDRSLHSPHRYNGQRKGTRSRDGQTRWGSIYRRCMGDVGWLVRYHTHTHTPTRMGTATSLLCMAHVLYVFGKRRDHICGQALVLRRSAGFPLHTQAKQQTSTTHATDPQQKKPHRQLIAILWYDPTGMLHGDHSPHTFRLSAHAHVHAPKRLHFQHI